MPFKFAYLIPLLVLGFLIGYGAFETSSHAAPPGHCNPWPSCKNTTSVSSSTTTTTPSLGGTTYCFGDPTAANNGWPVTSYNSNDTTTENWVRQGYPGTLSTRVVFDDSVNVMQSLGCHTVRAEIQPNDLATDGSTGTSQGAKLAKNTGWNGLDAIEGHTHWYGFAFKTNAGYIPHSSDPALGDYSGDFNLVYSFHDLGIGAQANIQLEITTISPSDNRGCWTYAPGVMHQIAPVWAVKISGGDATHATWYLNDADPTSFDTNRECAFYSLPFLADHLYRAQWKVTWGAHRNGAVQLWLEGTKVLDLAGISNMWFNASGNDPGIYPVFENYRKYDTGLPTNSVYYGGLLVGDTQADVTVP